MSKSKLSRKQFLKILGGLVVVAGAFGVYWRNSKSTEVNPPRTPIGSKTDKSLVSIFKGSSNTNIETMIHNALIPIGGMEKVVSSGQLVVVKPSVISSNPNCAPDPRVVLTVAKLAQDAGGNVTVAENSASGGAKYCLSKIGITDAIESIGIEVKDLSKEKELIMEIPHGVKLQSVKTDPTIYESDVIISVPRLRRHGGATVTISLKGMMGTITTSEMNRFHRIGLSQCIADLNTVFRPDLTVVDATYVMTRTGPTNGDMVEMNTIFASRDPVACDRVAAQRLHELEQNLGISTFDSNDVNHINSAGDLGVGTADLAAIDIIEELLY